jgi:hypothetical protein
MIGDTIIVGDLTQGTFVQNGGDISTNIMAVGNNNVGKDAALYTMNGGSLSCGTALLIGLHGPGSFTQYAGTSIDGGGQYFEVGVGDVGNYVMYGGSLTADNETVIGWGDIGAANGSLEQYDGSFVTKGRLILGREVWSGFYPAYGSIALSGGHMLVGQDAIIGCAGGGFVHQTDGNAFIRGNLYLGGAIGSDATGILLGGLIDPNYTVLHGDGNYLLSGGHLTVDGNEVIGNYGTGIFSQTDGNHLVGGSLNLGYQRVVVGSNVYAANGNYALTGGTLSVGGDLCVGGSREGSGGTGSFSVTGGVATIDGNVQIWSAGRVELGAGTFGASDANFYINVYNDGNLHVSAGATHALGDVLPRTDPSVLTGTTYVHSGGSLTVNRIVQSTLTVEEGASLVLRNSAAKTTSVVNTLAIAGTPTAPLGKVDIGKNYLVITAPGQLTSVNSMIASAMNYNNSPAYGWDGNGITSSLAAADTTGVLSVGCGNADYEGLTGHVYGGYTLAATDTLVMLTIVGDADLSGTVDLVDYNILKSNYGATNATWEMGDFDGDGVVGPVDYNMLKGCYGMSVPDAPGMLGEAYGAVPEPATMVLLALGVSAMLGWRRGKKLQS